MMATLKECCNLLIDGDWIESKDQSTAGLRLIQTGNVGNGQYLEKQSRAKYISEETFIRLGCTEVFPGDILISRLPEPVGRACIIPQKPERMITAVDCSILRVNERIIDRKYLLFFLQSQSYFNQLTGKLAGTTRVRISRKNLEKVYLPIPGKRKQAEIAGILSRVTDIKTVRQKQLNALDDLIKARFVELFGDCRLNPKGWKTVPLGNIAEVGSSKRVFVEELKESGIPFYRGTEVGALAEGKKVIPELFITEEHYDELVKATGKPEPGDLLMPSICPDGRIWVVDTDDPFYFKDGRVLWVHGIDTRFDPVFLLYTLKDRIMTDYGSIASGTTFAELKIFALKQCQVFDVPIEEQRSFAAFITQVDKSKKTIQEALKETQTLLNSLLKKYFG